MQTNTDNETTTSTESSSIEAEIDKINQCLKIIDASWSFEVKLYEHNVQQNPSSLCFTCTKVNGKNEEQEEDFDSRIFPYHKTCYRLLDMYLGLERPFEFGIYDSEGIEELRTEITMFRLYLDEEMIATVDGYLPCSYSSICKTLLSSKRRTKMLNVIYDDIRHIDASMNEPLEPQPMIQFGTFIKFWRNEIWNERIDQIRECYIYDSYEEAQTRHYENSSLKQSFNEKGSNNTSIENIPKGLRTKVLLKLLKHSMSELQRDHELSQAIIFSMIDNECFVGKEGVEAMRYFFLTFVSEYIYHCDGECHQTYIFNRPDGNVDDLANEYDDDSQNPKPAHYCEAYSDLLAKIEFSISDGITYMTKEHSEMIIGLVVHVFDIAGWDEVDELIELMGYDDDDSITHNDKPHQLLYAIIRGVGFKAYGDRSRLKCLLRWKYKNKEGASAALDEEIKAVKESHLASVSTLVKIGKITLLRLPADNVTEQIGSQLVRFLVLSSIDLIPHERCQRSHDFEPRQYFIGDEFGAGINESVTNYNRYAEGIHEFKLRKRRVDDIKRTFLDFVDLKDIESDELIKEIFLSPPSMQLQNVVRALFLSQLVDVNYSGCGYGDFLVWCRLPIHIYDPMLYEHIVNYPSSYINGDDDDSDEEDDANKLKYFDDDGNILKGGYLRARYDFSLLRLKQVWAEPWSFHNHSSFQPGFRDAIWTMLLCAHRYGMSSDIPNIICSFLPRSFWPDDRIKCWRYECEIESIDCLIYERGKPKSMPPVVNPSCMTAHACNLKHLGQILHEGHERVCNLPPLRVFSKEDAKFCKDIVLKKSGHWHNDEENDKIDKHDREDDEDDSDSCWESVASEDDGNISETELIFRYFDSNAYKCKQLEAPAFAAFYSDS